MAKKKAEREQDIANRTRAAPIEKNRTTDL